MSESLPTAENDALRETLIDFALWGGDTREDAEWAAETFLSERAVSLALTYQSPGGRSLTRCCCDRTTARLVVCPEHPEAHVTPPAEQQGVES